ncbi:MAG TPA: hypothetical protein VE395_01100 [Acidimicrobiales bacterium]|nr:hypothetical protein [Acidimicrobiales bacterium]
MAQAAVAVDAPVAGPTSPGAPERASRLPEVLLLVAVLLALLPIATATVRALDHDWFPVGDNSVVYARTTDVFSDDTPLLYMWSSGSDWAEEDFNNPGPMFYWVLAVPTALFGPTGQAVAVALLNAGAIVGIALVARRRGGPLLAVAAVAVAATLGFTLGSSLLYDPWPPNSLVLPSLLYLLLVWCVADGDLVALPLLAGVGSLLLETNLSYAVLAPALALFGVAALVLHLRRERRRDPTAWPALRRRVRRWGLGTAAVLAVCWTPTVVEQLTSEGEGNLTLIARGMGALPIELGPSGALRLMASVTAEPRFWFRGSLLEAYAWPPSEGRAVVESAVVVAVLAGVAWLAARRRDRLAVAGIATAACALVVAFVTVSQSPVDGFGLLSPYRTRFLWPVAAFTTLVVAVALLRRFLRSDRSRTIGIVALVAVTAGVALANLPAHWAPYGTHEPSFAPAVVQDLRRQLAGVGDGQRVRFDWSGDSFNYQFWAAGVIADLAERGVPFTVVDEHLVRTLGEERRSTGDDDVELTLRTGDRAEDAPEGAQRVALHEGLAPEDQRELRALREQVTRYIDDGNLRLTPEGERGLAALGGREASDEGLDDGERLVRERAVGRLMAQGFLELDDTWEPRVRRYVGLEGFSDDHTVAVFLRPLAPADG